MLEETFEECNEAIRNADKLLRKLEKTSKMLTQHVQTSILAFDFQRNQDGLSGEDLSQNQKY